MRKVSASDAKNRFGGVLEDAALHGRVDIVKHGRVVAIVLSPKAFDELVRARGAQEEDAWSRLHAIAPQNAKQARIVRMGGDFEE